VAKSSQTPGLPSPNFWPSSLSPESLSHNRYALLSRIPRCRIGCSRVDSVDVNTLFRVWTALALGIHDCLDRVGTRRRHLFQLDESTYVQLRNVHVSYNHTHYCFSFCLKPTISPKAAPLASNWVRCQDPKTAAKSTDTLTQTSPTLSAQTMHASSSMGLHPPIQTPSLLTDPQLQTLPGPLHPRCNSLYYCLLHPTLPAPPLPYMVLQHHRFWNHDGGRRLHLPHPLLPKGSVLGTFLCGPVLLHRRRARLLLRGDLHHHHRHDQSCR
jgi:hypothetical protein